MSDTEELRFTNGISQLIISSSTVIAISLGTRLGLFKALAELAPDAASAVTSHQLADKLHFKERYVREWIHGMVVNGMVDYVPSDDGDKFWLATYRHRALVGSPDGWIGQYSEMIVACAEAQKMVEKCFPLDGPPGTRVEDHPSIHSFLDRNMSFFKNPSNIELLVKEIPNVKEMLERGVSVIEFGCGAAHCIKNLATLYPKSQFLATELSAEILERARENCAGLENVTFKVIDGCAIPSDLTGRFDLALLIDVLHDTASPIKLLQGIHSALSETGKLLINEIDMHSRLADNVATGMPTAIYMISTHYCVPTSLYHPGGAGLGAVAGREVIEGLLREAGFTSVVRMQSLANMLGLMYDCSK